MLPLVRLATISVLTLKTYQYLIKLKSEKSLNRVLFRHRTTCTEIVGVAILIYRIDCEFASASSQSLSKPVYSQVIFI